MKIINKLFSPRYLLYTNVALGSGFYAFGDFSQQNFTKISKMLNKPDLTTLGKHNEKYNFEYDKQRTVAMAKTGIFLGLFGHYWYKILDYKLPGTCTRILIKKLGLEMLAGPPFVLLTFLCLGIFENKSMETSYKNFKSNISSILAIDWGFYVPLQFFNFKLVPPRFRFLYVSCITLIYDTFLSFLLHNNDHK